MGFRTLILLLGLLSVSSISPIEIERGIRRSKESKLPPPRYWVSDRPNRSLLPTQEELDALRFHGLSSQDIKEAGIPASYQVTVRLSWYDPELCITSNLLINCLHPESWWRMGGGLDARLWYDKALACPRGFYGRSFQIDGFKHPRVCLDSGGRIIVEPETYIIRLDVLTKTPIRNGLRQARILP